MRSRDDHEVARRQQIRQTLNRPQCLDAFRRLRPHGIDGQHAHAERQAATSDLGADAAQANNAERGIAQMHMSAVDGADNAGAGCNGHARLLAADRRPVPAHLLDDVLMQIARETENVAEHLIGDHVREQAAHVGQHAGMSNQFRKKIMFEAGGGRLHPAQLPGGGQQRRRELAEEGVGVRHVNARASPSSAALMTVMEPASATIR